MNKLIIKQSNQLIYSAKVIKIKMKLLMIRIRLKLYIFLVNRMS